MSRLERLFLLLDTGSSASIKKAAAQQLGEVQKLYPHELHYLLAKVSILLKSPQWDTRIAAANAVEAIVSQVPLWDPQPPLECEDINFTSKDFDQRGLLNLDTYDINTDLAQHSFLYSNDNNEFDFIFPKSDFQKSLDEFHAYNKFDFFPHNSSINSEEIFSIINTDVSSTLSETKPNSCTSNRYKSRQVSSFHKTCSITTGMKNYQEENDKKQKFSENKDTEGIQNAQNFLGSKKIKLENSLPTIPWYDLRSNSTTDSRCVTPDETNTWPDSVISWPFQAFTEMLFKDIFDPKWEVRHGAATALRNIIKLHGRGAGKLKNQSVEEMEDSNRKWLIDSALRILCILGIDRFGDFISDQVVAPVRETCAQVFGCIVDLLSKQNNSSSIKSDILGLLTIVLKLFKNQDWEARHGSLLALKYLLLFCSDLHSIILPKIYPEIIEGLSDSVEDVGAMMAGALIPIAKSLIKTFNCVQIDTIVSKLLKLLDEQDDLASACNSFMGLLAVIISSSTYKRALTFQPLQMILPRFLLFLHHSSSNIRKASLRTLEIVTTETRVNDSYVHNYSQESYEVQLFQEILHNIFQRILIEHIHDIQDTAENVWINILTQNKLELILYAACPLISTWFCLCMQPENVIYNTYPISYTKKETFTVGENSGLKKVRTELLDRSYFPTSGCKIYIGGIETVPEIIRNSNATRARCAAARMLGLLTKFIFQSQTIGVYIDQDLQPTLCYLKIVVTHLKSKSALQRMFVGLTLSSWAKCCKDHLPNLPECLREHLLLCLSEYPHYDEMANSLSRFIKDFQDFKAELHSYKMYLDVKDGENDAMTIDNLIRYVSSPLCLDFNHISINQDTKFNETESMVTKHLEEKKKLLKLEILSNASQQQALHIKTSASLAGASIMFHYLPDAPQPLNPLIKPLMESIKKEENEILQKLSAEHLAELMDLCSNREPCPNSKIINNLCRYLCSDPDFTPLIAATKDESEYFNGVITLSNKQRFEKITNDYRNTYCCIKPLDNLAAQESTGSPNDTGANSAKIRRKGAFFALTTIVKQMGSDLPSKMSDFWRIILPESLKNYMNNENRRLALEEVNQIISNLQIIEVILPYLE